jgi:hypothetical protein
MYLEAMIYVSLPPVLDVRTVARQHLPMQSEINTYIRSNTLQDKENGRKINPGRSDLRESPAENDYDDDN